MAGRTLAELAWTCWIGSCDGIPFEGEIAHQEHLYEVHGVSRPRTSFMCRARDCSRRFVLEPERNNHEITEHGGETDQRDHKRPIRLPQEPSRRQQYICALGGCIERFDSRQGLGAHRAKEHPGWTAADIDHSLLSSEESDVMSGASERAEAVASLQIEHVKDEEEPMGKQGEQFVCGVVEEGTGTCLESFGSPQARGAHRRHSHPGWTVENLDENALGVDDPERRQDVEVPDQGVPGDESVAQASSAAQEPPPDVEGAAEARGGTQDGESSHGRDDAEGASASPRVGPPSTSTSLDWSSTAGLMEDLISDIDEREFYVLEDVPLRKGEGDRLDTLAYLEDVSVEAIVSRAIRAYLASETDEHVQTIADAKRAYRERHAS